jgi:hypothetical protein
MQCLTSGLYPSLLSALIAPFSRPGVRGSSNGPGEKFSASVSERGCEKFSGRQALCPWPCAARGTGHNSEAMRGGGNKFSNAGGVSAWPAGGRRLGVPGGRVGFLPTRPWGQTVCSIRNALDLSP